MIVITGAGGFIGSCLVGYFNTMGHKDLILVDEANKKHHAVLDGKEYLQYIDRDVFAEWLHQTKDNISFVVHIGARTDTMEYDENIFEKLNISYTKKLWEVCVHKNIPIIYASSAATYGDGTHGYSDHHDLIPKLEPLNPYAWSKQIVDEWILRQVQFPPYWIGLKFFNVFGPNEYHKNKMASVIYHGYHQIKNTGKIRLFKSNDSNISDGEQKRDFIYVKEIVETIYTLYKNRIQSGIYNLGTGTAHSFNQLAKGIFEALGMETNIEYMDMPDHLMKSYQNFTEADMNKLRHAIHYRSDWTFQRAISDYVNNYLDVSKYF